MKKKNDHGVFAAVRMAAASHRLLTVGTVLCVAASVAASLLPPLLLARVIDRLTAGLPLSFLAVLLYFGSLALEGVLTSAQESLLVLFGQRMTHALRSEMSRKLSRLPAGTLAEQNPGEVAARFSGDVDTVEVLFTSGIISMFADVCRVISIFAVIWFRNRGIAMLLALLIPLIFVFTRIVQKRMLAAQLENRAAVSRVTNHVPETIRCIRTIHTLRKEAYMERRYDDYIGESYAAIEKTNFYDAVYSPVILFLNAVVVAAVMLFAASGNKRVLTLFGMSVGTSVAVINYISQIFSPIENLGMEIQTIQSAVAGVCRINEFLAKPEREMVGERVFTDFAHKNGKAGAEPCIEFKDVTFGYDDHIVLNDLNFAIDPGEQVTLTGRTGVGKSTIFKLLLGLYRPDSGKVLIEGEAAYRITDKEKRKKFGYVEQSFHMVPGTIRDQITLFDPEIGDEAVQASAKLVGLHETIMSLDHGYDTLCKPEIFSQGQWQLLSIARAVAGEPKILLLDEITANLDAETEEMVLCALKYASEGRTVISISHRVYRRNGADQIRYLAIGS